MFFSLLIRTSLPTAEQAGVSDCGCTLDAKEEVFCVHVCLKTKKDFLDVLTGFTDAEAMTSLFFVLAPLAV